MIFKLEMVEKILAGEKTVTRRPVEYVTWRRDARCRYEVGKDYAVQPGGGKKAVARIRVTDVRRGLLAGVDTADAIREGFGGRGGFVVYWTGIYGSFDSTQLVDRIEFELLPESPKARAA